MYILFTWQGDWNSAVANERHYVKLVLGDWQSSCMWCRKDEIVLNRACIGHTHLIHSLILNREPLPHCEQASLCQAGLGRLAVLQQAEQEEGRKCFI